MTPVFVLTFSDVVGIFALAIILLLALFVYVADKITRWKNKRKVNHD